MRDTSFSGADFLKMMSRFPSNLPQGNTINYETFHSWWNVLLFNAPTFFFLLHPLHAFWLRIEFSNIMKLASVTLKSHSVFIYSIVKLCLHNSLHFCQFYRTVLHQYISLSQKHPLQSFMASFSLLLWKPQNCW